MQLGNKLRFGHQTHRNFVNVKDLKHFIDKSNDNTDENNIKKISS